MDIAHCKPDRHIIKDDNVIVTGNITKDLHKIVHLEVSDTGNNETTLKEERSDFLYIIQQDISGFAAEQEINQINSSQTHPTFDPNSSLDFPVKVECDCELDHLSFHETTECISTSRGKETKNPSIKSKKNLPPATKKLPRRCQNISKNNQTKAEITHRRNKLNILAAVRGKCERFKRLNESDAADHTCDICKRSFILKRELKFHIYKHIGITTFSCPICKKMFFKCGSLNGHYRQVHSGKKLFHCDICSKSFTRVTNLNFHSRMHLEKKFCCDLCDEQLDFRDKHAHMKTHASSSLGPKPYLCEICGKTFASKTHSSVHSLKIISKTFTCDICDKGFTSGRNLLKHKVIHSDNMPSFLCNICNKTYRRKNSLKVHRRLHFNEGRFPCTICDKSYTERYTLNKHLLVHSGARPFECDQCEMAFNRSNHLKSHLLIHTGLRQFKCDQCDKSYLRNSHLKKHKIAFHLRIKPYPCQLCDKEYASKEFLDKHTKSVHLGITPFICDPCDMKFNTKVELKRHIKMHISL